MRNKVSALICAMVVLGGGMLTASPAAAASTGSPTASTGLAAASAGPASAATFAAAAPCGLSYSWGTARWRNCTSRGQYIGEVVMDPLTGRIYNAYQCVPANSTRWLSPTMAVVHAWVAGSC